MKNRFSFISFLCLLLLTSCNIIFNAPNTETQKGKDNNGDSTTSVPSTTDDSNQCLFFKTLSADDTSITFDQGYNGKKCYLICSNESSQNIDNSNIGLQFNQNETEADRSAAEQMVLLNNTVQFEDGFWRDEIQFERPELKIFNARAAAATSTETVPVTYRDLNDDKFWAQTGNTVYTQETFIKKKEGTHCRIWYLYNNTSVSNSYLTDAEFQKLADNIDAIFTKETQVFGSNHYDSGYNYYIKADANTKLDVLVYDLLGDATETQSGGVFGFFRAGDFFLNSVIEEINETYNYNYAANYNGCEAIHIDSYFLNSDVKDQKQKVQSTLIHEFQHLLNYCNKTTNYQTWFTEMLSMSAEDVFQSQINLSDEDSPKSRFYITFDTPYLGFGNWPANSDEKVYNAYANAYAFGAYLMRNYGGIRLIHEIATNQYVDKEAITKALETLGYSETFDTVFRKFGMTYIFPDSQNDTNTKNLNRAISEKFMGTTYCLGAIDLNKYYFKVYNSKTDLDNDMNNNLYSVGQKYGSNQDKTSWAIFGPRIFKSTYQLPDVIQQYGFAVYYLGTIKAGKQYTVTPKTNLTMSVVVKG